MRVIPVLALLILAAFGVNWLALRSETKVERLPLSDIPETLGAWNKRGSDFRFSKDVEDVLKASDYTMREYEADGRIANIYVGYYETQRTGATYHSPQNCLPGAGWVLSDPAEVNIPLSDGRSFTANRYFIDNGKYREVMIYWYQGRGRTETSEYRDKINTVLDSVSLRRTDGAMIRVMTGVGSDPEAAEAAAIDLSSRLADKLGPFVP